MLSNIYMTIYVGIFGFLLGMFFWQLSKFQRSFGSLRPTLQILQTEIIPQYGDTLGKTRQLPPEMEKKRVDLYNRFYENYRRVCYDTKMPTVFSILMALWSIVPMLVDYFADTLYLNTNIGLTMIGVSVVFIVMATKLTSNWEDFAYKYKREFDSYSAVVHSA